MSNKNEVDDSRAKRASVISNSSNKDVLNTILDDPFNRKEAEEYVKWRDYESHIWPSPEVMYLKERVFPTLREAIEGMLLKVKEDNSFYKVKSTLNGLDYLSEFLYNKNPQHPERAENWTYIFDMDWVTQHLEENPRPYYPLRLIWTDEHAALKIQSYLRGYWVRRMPDVEELRRFWKELRQEKEYRFNSEETI